MKKTIITIITILLFCGNIHAQAIWPPVGYKDVSNMTVIDSFNIRISYAFNAVDINKQETYDDLQRLEIGSRISKYYSYFKFNSDSLITVFMKKNPNPQGIPGRLGAIGKKSSWDEYRYSEYFKDYTKNNLKHYIHKPFGLINPYQYSEDMPEQTWEIAEDTLTIAGYLCQKATCTFRGRNFTAWFTMDIPIQNGPWKLGGLPGLILKAHDDDTLHIFECVKIENFKKKYPIKIYDYKNYEKIERQKLLKFVKKLYEDYYNVSGLGIPNFKKIPYNPLELE